MKKIFIYLLFTLCFPLIHAQQNTTVVPPLFIKGIEFKPPNPDAYAPIIRLGEKLILKFDDINAEERIYYYSIKHCDYNWQISDLSSTEYMTGYATDRIRNYRNSFNTLQYYTHYELEIPNNNNRIRISGNYLVNILDESGNIIFNRRFIVYEPKVNVAVTAHRSTDPRTINEKHSIQFVIDHPNLLLNNPYQEIKVDVYQNSDWNSVLKGLQPKFTRGTQLLYNYVDGISYWAGNEYLYFDTKRIRNATNNIFKTRLDNIFNTFLYTNQARGGSPYSFYPDINGNFVLTTQDTGDEDLEGDYSLVHFTLQYDTNFDQDDIYIYGAFNDWQITPENKMRYNSETGLYEASLLMKQGFYNYTHVAVDKDFQINPYKVDGSFYQTENEYSVIVYYRKFGDRYDQVIGIGTTNSQQLFN